MMAQRQRIIFLPLIGTALIGALIGAYLFALKRSSKSASSSGVKKHRVKTAPEEALAYWTKERMQQAQPMPMPHVEAKKAGKRSSKRAPKSSQSSENE
jgi:hypothetical protein